jgi:hypothetical protein
MAFTISASLACLVDYTCTPPRFRPGFEKRLSLPSLALAYIAFAAGLAGAALIRPARPSGARPQAHRLLIFRTPHGGTT